MPKLSKKSKIAIIIIGFILLVVIGGLFFPVPQPEVHLSANYGGEHSPEPFYKLGPIYITNTLIASWLSIILLIGFFYLATRKMKLVPKGLQNFAETIMEIFLNFVEGVAGRENGRRFFPIIATIFFYVLVNAWMGLLPFFNVIGEAHYGTSDTLFYKLFGMGQYSGPIIGLPLFRAANTDINVPLMLALVSFLSVEYWGITSLGMRHYASKFIRVGQLFHGFGQLIKGRVKEAIIAILFGIVDAFVGALELVSEFVRIISFTFRLFGNMTAGEILLLMMAFLVPWIIPVLFYGLETLIGFIQALIFAGLTLVFATVAVTAHQSEH
ncbi:MAG TPA: F0F1 ATP synthase subunit A [Dehalococcoidia bacterium]|nr:F0F1 ATP synthase subunit A [Dehalococcoidia bacterium]